MPFSTTLRTRFAVAFALSIIVASALLSAAIGNRSSAEVRGEIGRSLAEVAYHMADKLDRGMWARSGEVAVLATIVTLAGPDNLVAIRRSLDELRAAVPIFSWIGFSDPHGKVLASSDGILTGADISKRPVYTQGVSGTFVGDVHDAVMLAKLLPNPSGEPMKFVDVSTPIRAADGRLVGVLAAHLSWAWANEVRDSVLAPMEGRRETEIFVISSDNTVLLGPVGAAGQPLSLASIETARAGGQGWRVERWPDGRDYLTGYAFGHGHGGYQGLGWTILARQPLDAAFAPVHALQRDIILWGAGVAVLFAVIGWLLAGPVAAPLARIAKAADRLRLGEPVEIPNHRGIRDVEVLTASLRALITSLSLSEAARDRAEDQANQDRLTGLPNRLAMETHLALTVASARRGNHSIAVLCLDLDGFKLVNDTLGHHAGDVLLQQVAGRLSSCGRQGDLVARLGGDEFVMVLKAADGRPIEDGVAVGERIIAALGQPFTLDGAPVSIGCSVGLAVWPLHADDINEAIRLADAALYAAKRGGKNRVCVHEGVDVV